MYLPRQFDQPAQAATHQAHSAGDDQSRGFANWMRRLGLV